MSQPDSQSPIHVSTSMPDPNTFCEKHNNNEDDDYDDMVLY